MSNQPFGHFRRLDRPSGRKGRAVTQLRSASASPSVGKTTQQTDTLMIVGGMMFPLLLVILLLYRNQE